jgi:hypothetical protein
MRGGKLSRVSSGVVEVLQARTLANDTIGWTQTFELGRVVRIADGRFADLIGTLEHFDAAGPFRILLNLLWRPVSVASRGEVLLPTA